MRFLWVLLFVFVGYAVESVIKEIFGGWFCPNLLLILVVFFNLFKGIRYSIGTAVLAGLLKDSYSAGIFGQHIFSFVLCAYLTVFIKTYLYHTSSHGSRVFFVFLVSFLNVLILYALNVMLGSVSFVEMVSHVLVPEVLSTTLVTPFVYRKYKQCALKLFA